MPCPGFRRQEWLCQDHSQGPLTPCAVSQFEPALQRPAEHHPGAIHRMTQWDNRTPRQARDSPLDQLHDALGVHEEDFPVSLPLQRGRVAVQDGGYLGGERTGLVTHDHTIQSSHGSHPKHPPQAPVGVPPEAHLKKENSSPKALWPPRNSSIYPNQCIA